MCWVDILRFLLRQLQPLRLIPQLFHKLLFERYMETLIISSAPKYLPTSPIFKESDSLERTSSVPHLDTLMKY